MRAHGLGGRGSGPTRLQDTLVSAGKMKGLAFIQDPDGYWIEILSPNTMLSITS